MADYTPVFQPGDHITLTLAGSCVGGDLLEVAGSGTVRKCATAATLAYVGVAMADGVAGARVGVYGRGFVHESVAQGAITAGDQLVSSDGLAGNAGKQVKTLPPVTVAPVQGDVNNARGVLGVALITVADGGKVRWMQC